MAAASRTQRKTLALLGLRCSGKTTVGQRLGVALGTAFVDLDARCLEVGRRAGWKADSVGELLERAGQARFRALEALALRHVLEPEPRVVLATGGGVVERPDNRTWLERTARCVYLAVPLTLLRRRLAADPTPRPALLGGDAGDELPELLARREPAYRTLAEVVIECGEAGPDEIVERIRSALGPSIE